MGMKNKQKTVVLLLFGLDSPLFFHLQNDRQRKSINSIPSGTLCRYQSSPVSLFRPSAIAAT